MCIRGLYRGVSAPLLGVSPIFALCFWGYDMGQKLARKISNKRADEALNITEIMFAGGFSAIPTTVRIAGHSIASITVSLSEYQPFPVSGCDGAE